MEPRLFIYNDIMTDCSEGFKGSSTFLMCQCDSICHQVSTVASPNMGRANACELFVNELRPFLAFLRP